MAHIHIVKINTELLAPATEEARIFLHRVKLGEWIHADFKRVRNYRFHKKFFKLLQLGFEYWTPTGGMVTPEECQFLDGFIAFVCKRVGEGHSAAFDEAANLYINEQAIQRSNDTALLKDFEVFREWATIQAGYFTTHINPDGSRWLKAKSISFSNMDESEFEGLYKSVLNVLWNYILYQKFSSQIEVENVAAQLLEYAA
ncbi:DUF1367 family protein [Klebsiella oxytoca]|uniref:DUF1367 family protein n=1 Tax=Klebsiella oxytoca TaxID=571 RepID=UPI001918AA82|nr:DUF1367 family protein [Klebsiella oxytoca]HAT1590673.1 DUF1367 family protein [Klebsiella oxytoca]HBM2984778.1 DUF1367 family protein [Klebsiella oxytoca]HCD7239043.1 DUF1367 family protein [Klebsiella oxytoca]